jgi:hypothetical protein
MPAPKKKQTLSDIFPGVSPSASELQNLFMPYNPKVVPGAQVYSYADEPNTYGLVFRRMPNSILLNSQAKMSEAPHVIPHELEHVLQNRVADRMKPNSFDSEVVKQFDINKLRAQLNRSATDKSIPEYFKNTYNFPIKYYGAMGPDQYSLKEQWAELSAAEQYLKKDLTQDQFVRNKIFGNNQDMIDTYKATSGLRMDRWDSKDLPPMTKQPR